MKFITALMLVLGTGSPAYAEGLRLDCKPTDTDLQQGEERFFRAEFSKDTGDLVVASMEAPFASVTRGLRLRAYNYSDSTSHAMAAWAAEGGDVVVASFNFFGRFWGGHVRFQRPITVGILTFASGEEYDLYCKERP
jgi:hypothetical protein